jgi:hypothetical protein
MGRTSSCRISAGLVDGDDVQGVRPAPAQASASGKPAAAAWDAALDRAVTAALAQIEAKGYAERYRGTSRRVYKVGIAVADRGIGASK